MKPVFLTALILSVFWAQATVAATTSEETEACVENPSVACVVKLMFKTAETSGTPKQRTHSYAALADSYERAHRREEAALYWKLALSAAQSAPEGEARDESLAHYVAWSGRRSEVKQVIATAEQIGRSETRDRALMTLAKALADEQLFDQAKEVLARRIDSGPLSSAYAHLSMAQAGSGKIEEAWTSFRVYQKAYASVRESLISLDGVPETIPSGDEILGQIAVALIKAGRRKDAFDTLSRMTTDNYALFAKVEIAATQAELGNINEARRTVNGMKPQAPSSQFGKVQARQLKDRALARIADALAKRGELKRAVSTASKIKNDERHDEAIAQMAFTYVIDGGSEKLPWILNQKRMPLPLEAESPQTVGIYYANSGKTDKAREHFDRIPVEIWPIPVYSSVAIRWSHIATLRHDHGDHEGAARVLAKTLSYGRETNRGQQYGFVASIVALHQSKQGRFSEAVSTAVSIGTEAMENRATALRHILIELLANQNP